MSKKIVITKSLSGFFFDQLGYYNEKMPTPLPEEMIFYSSQVLEKFSVSEKFFEKNEGKLKEKILGMMYLESTHDENRASILREVGEMSLLLCGYFHKSINRKILHHSYYKSLGKSAYKQLDSYFPNHMDIPSFYHKFSSCFEQVTATIGLISREISLGELDTLFEFSSSTDKLAS